MSLGGVSLNYNQIYSVSHSSAGSRVQVPVSAGQVLYAQFRFVQGIAAGPGDSATPINHLKVMDSLIQALSDRGIKVPKIVQDSADPLKVLGHLRAPEVKAPAPYVNKPAITGIMVDIKA
ncbi:MAG: hypothetical protein A2Z96_05150 [Spirochaetes bacterium GWB1_48_6]|nr:MAG: hypothetical protein A2Z96_05150 [Spirochaetes bacterium GWB1_48_6]